MENRNIPINIWDDFYEDGYVPEGEIQQTYAYVEDYSFSHEFAEQCLLKLEQAIGELPGVEMKVEFYDSALKYPQFVGTEHEFMLYKRWQLNFKHLSHELLHITLKRLKGLNLFHEGLPFRIYSES